MITGLSNTLPDPRIESETPLLSSCTYNQSTNETNECSGFKEILIMQRHAFYPRRCRKRCTLRHVIPLYKVHPLLTICVINAILLKQASFQLALAFSQYSQYVPV
ncbi:hypothetical protein SFRURICE_006639 [Spodoptera frugiperda]|uniref:SFRICE_036802 n=1 Tax=Spodoptera frugiperda TaxID=7108 RepID=A0A2H1WQ38_SPOFR|nr:hypothetical protein SFRURICE_006639 [Spodoptera frugiperda]